MQIIAGDFGANYQAVLNSNRDSVLTSIVLGRKVFGQNTILAEWIAHVETLTEESKVAWGKALGSAAAGWLLAGPLGGLGAALLGGRKKAHTVVISLTNGTRILAVVSTEEYQMLLGATLSPHKPESIQEARSRMQDEQNLTAMDFLAQLKDVEVNHPH